jgi:hypothetical protein
VHWFGSVTYGFIWRDLRKNGVCPPRNSLAKAPGSHHRLPIENTLNSQPHMHPKLLMDARIHNLFYLPRILVVKIAQRLFPPSVIYLRKTGSPSGVKPTPA